MNIYSAGDVVAIEGGAIRHFPGLKRVQVELGWAGWLGELGSLLLLRRYDGELVGV